MKRSPRRRARRAQGIFGKCGRVEIRSAVARIAVQPKASSDVIRAVKAVVVDPIGNASLERVVAVDGESHGKSSTCASYSRDCPTLRQPAHPAAKALQWKLISIGRDEVVGQIPGRESS